MASQPKTEDSYLLVNWVTINIYNLYHDGFLFSFSGPLLCNTTHVDIITFDSLAWCVMQDYYKPQVSGRFFSVVFCSTELFLFSNKKVETCCGRQRTFQFNRIASEPHCFLYENNCRNSVCSFLIICFT